MFRRLATATAALATVGAVLVPQVPAGATPVCTDGYKGGPPLAACDGRIFPEAAVARDYVQYDADPAGFMEYRHGIEYLAQKYPRWVSVFTLSQRYADPRAVSVGGDRLRSYEPGDTGDGREILVVKLTDHEVPDAGKDTLLFSLSIHGDEKGGVEGGLRAAEDLAIAATDGGTISDGVEGYESTTGNTPEFHSYEVKDVLAKEAVYLVDFNVDGWANGDNYGTPGLYSRGNSLGTDLNRQMPTVGRIDPSRNPLEESEALYGHRFMHEIADEGIGGRMAYGADVHGESNSRAWVDIMYPAGQFNSVKHRQLMAIAERTKSVIDETLFEGIPNAIEELTGGDAGEGIEDYTGAPKNTIPTKPARWGTVWDTLGYTDTGFVGDYMASELGITGMDYEIFQNHADSRAVGRPWSVALQENYINATRGIVKTAMAYALTVREEFNADTVRIPTGGGTAGYVYNPEVVTDADGAGRLPGPSGDGIGRNGRPVDQAPYSATNMGFFEEEAPFVEGGLTPVYAADIADDPTALEGFDSLVLADFTVPADALGRPVDAASYKAALKSWVEDGGNLVLTDRALHLLGDFGIVAPAAVKDIKVYQPYANISDHEHPMVEGLRGNARQLAEATLVGYGIGNSASPMTVVTTSAFEAAGGHVVGTTGNNSGSSDDGTQTSVGELAVGAGKIRIMGGGLPMPTETQDHRYGLKDFALSYSGLYILENSLNHNSEAPNGAELPGGVLLLMLVPVGVIGVRRRRLDTKD